MSQTSGAGDTGVPSGYGRSASPGTGGGAGEDGGGGGGGDEQRGLLPSLALPKGGGAIAGIGEKLSTNPVTGTGSFSVPIAVSPGRGKLQPDLSLSYDSGSGNGLFGWGVSLSLSGITRKTDKGLPL